MSVSLRSAQIQHKVKLASMFTKVAEDLLPDMPTDKANLNKQVYEDVGNLGEMEMDAMQSEFDPADLQRYLMAMQQQDPSLDLGFKLGMQLGAGALKVYDDMRTYPGSTNHSDEKVAELVNEIMKVGQAGYEIDQMTPSTKTAEMKLINQTYFVDLLNQLVG